MQLGALLLTSILINKLKNIKNVYAKFLVTNSRFYLASTNELITPDSLVDDGDQVIRVVDSNGCEAEKTIRMFYLL